jgi:hypothetical protein
VETTRVGCIGCIRVYVIEGKDVTLVKDDQFDCRVCAYLLDAVTSVDIEYECYPDRPGEIPHCKSCSCGDYFKE